MQLKLKTLFLLIFVFAIILVFWFAYFNYNKNYQFLLDKQSRQIASTAHLLQDQMINSYHRAYIDMAQSESENLAKLYWLSKQIAKSKNYSLKDLKQQINKNVKNATIDIFLINKNYVVFDTTYQPDLNLDFHIIPAALEAINDVYFGKLKYDISKPMYIYGNTQNITLKKYFLIKPKELDFMVQIGVSHNSFDGAKMDEEIKSKLPNILSYDLYSIFKEKQPKNFNNVVSIISSNISKYSETKLNKTDYYKIIMNEQRFEKTYEKITGQKYTTDPKKVYATMLNELNKHNNMIVVNNGVTSTLVLPINLYIPYVDKYWQPTRFLIAHIDNTKLIKEVHDFQIINILYLSLFVAIFIAILVVVYLRILQPLFLMQDLMLKKEKIDTKTINQCKNELGDVMMTYNKLVDDLEEEIHANKTLLENLKNFTSNSVHQLKTPMSAMGIYLEMLKNIPKGDAIKDNLKSSLLMINHIHDTLSYKLQKEDVQFEPQNVNISSLLSHQIQ